MNIVMGAAGNMCVHPSPSSRFCLLVCRVSHLRLWFATMAVIGLLHGVMLVCFDRPAATSYNPDWAHSSVMAPALDNAGHHVRAWVS